MIAPCQACKSHDKGAPRLTDGAANARDNLAQTLESLKNVTDSLCFKTLLVCAGGPEDDLLLLLVCLSCFLSLLHGKANSVLQNDVLEHIPEFAFPRWCLCIGDHEPKRFCLFLQPVNELTICEDLPWKPWGICWHWTSTNDECQVV